jgi:hypothetical protein
MLLLTILKVLASKITRIVGLETTSFSQSNINVDPRVPSSHRHRHLNFNHENLIESLSFLYKGYIEEIKKTKNQDKKSSNEYQCSFRGKPIKIIHGNEFSSLRCQCNNGFIGDHCEISEELYTTMQRKLLMVLQEIETGVTDHWKLHKDNFFESMMKISQFRLSPSLIDKCLRVLKASFLHPTDNHYKRKVMNIFDSLFQQTLTLKNDLKNSIDQSNQKLGSDISTNQEKEKIERLSLKAVSLLEDFVEQKSRFSSLISKSSHSANILNSKSFTFAEMKLSNYNSTSGFIVSNPNSEGGHENYLKSCINLSFESDGDASKSPLHLQILIFSAEIFESHLFSLNKRSLGNITYLHFLHPDYPMSDVSFKDTGVKIFEINIALNFIPTFENLTDRISCEAINMTNNQYVSGKFLSFNDEKMTVGCQFYSYFNLRNIYFAVIMAL